MNGTLKTLLADPRHFQIAALSTLLAFGCMLRAFEIELVNTIALLSAALATQWLGSTMLSIRTDIRSALITTLSLTLLLRADSPGIFAAAAIIAIGSKFVLRANNKHIFNPTNIGIVVMLLISDNAWTTPGQWGSATWTAAAMVCAGFFVSYRAARWDVPVVFLATFAGLLFIRAFWLGDPLSIPLLRLENGALILFAFFMISDPMTTPDGSFARIAFSSMTALLAYILSFHFFISDGLFYALTIMCLIRPSMELFNQTAPYKWGDHNASAIKLPSPKFLAFLNFFSNPNPPTNQKR